MKQSTVQNLCMALLYRGGLVTSVSQVARVARVSKSTAHRFFANCENAGNMFVETKDGTFRKMHAFRYSDGTKVFHRGVVQFDVALLRDTDIIVRREGII